MTLRLTAFPCLAASISLGIGKGVLNGAGSPMPYRAQMSALDANAPQPRAKVRRVRAMAGVALVALYCSVVDGPVAALNPWWPAPLSSLEQFAKGS